MLIAAMAFGKNLKPLRQQRPDTQSPGLHHGMMGQNQPQPGGSGMPGAGMGQHPPPGMYSAYNRDSIFTLNAQHLCCHKCRTKICQERNI